MENIFPAPRSDCRGAMYCGKWRICERCARIRAARIADRAEFLAARHGRLALARLSPIGNTADAIRRARSKLIREKIAPAGLWTVESGELFGRLHLNLLIPADLDRVKTGGFDYWEPIKSSVRSVAAYIAKRQGMPQESAYTGRLFGEWGSIAQHLMKSTSTDQAAAQAALLQVTITQEWTHHGVKHWTKCQHGIAQQEPLPVREKSLLEYQEIARRHLPDLLRIVRPSLP